MIVECGWGLVWGWHVLKRSVWSGRSYEVYQSHLYLGYGSLIMRELVSEV